MNGRFEQFANYSFYRLYSLFIAPVRELGELIKTDFYFRLVCAQVFVWGFGDPVTTLLAYTAYGGHANEINPLTQPILAYDPILVVVQKGIAIALLGLIAVAGRKWIKAVPGWKIFFEFILYFGVGVTVVNSIAAYNAFT